jgi:phage portal protein BeeE
MGKALRAVATQKQQKTSPKRNTDATSAITNAWNGRVGKSNVAQFRFWAEHSEWVRGAINIRRSQVASAEWDIVPFDPKKPYSKRLQADLRDKFRLPNPANDSYRTFIEPIIEDILVLDAGVVEKERTVDGSIANLWPVDGATIRVSEVWDGDPDEDRYFWYPRNRLEAKFKNADMIYMMANRRSHSVVGLSALETLKLTIEAELYAHDYNRRQVAGAAPDGVMDLGKGASQQDIDRFREFFESEMAYGGTVGFIGGSEQAKWIDIRKSNRDMQFLEWQIYLVRKIAVVFGLSPQDLGVTFDVNRSTSEIQMQISEDRGLRPLMSLVQDYFTREVVWDVAYGGPGNNLAFRYKALNLKESTARAEMNKLALAGVPWKMFNEARVDEGREPVPAMEGKIIMATPQGAVDISDVPTVREMLEMQMAKREAPPPPPTDSKPPAGKAFDINVAAPDMNPIVDLVRMLNATYEARDSALLEAATRPQPAPQVTIDKGAVEVNVDAPVVNVGMPTPTPKSVTRHSKFEMDDRGRVIGKTETETRDMPSDPPKSVIRHSTFEVDEQGRIVGKTETETES